MSKYKRLSKYIKYLKPVKWQLAIAIVMGVLYGVSSGLGIPALIKFVAPVLFQKVDISSGMLIFYSALPVIIAGSRSLASFLNSYYVGFCGQYALQEIRIEIFEKIQSLPLAFFNKRTPGDLITRSGSDTATIQESIMLLAQEGIKQPITLIGALGYIIYLCINESNVLFLLIFILAIPLTIIPIRIVGLKLRKKAFDMQMQTAKLTDRMTQNLGAVKEVRSFCMEGSESMRYRETYKTYFGLFMKLLKYGVILTPIIEAVSAAGVGCAFFYAYSAKIPVEVFVSMTVALYMTYDPIKKLAHMNNSVQRGLASMERIEELLHEPVTIKDPDNPVEIDRLRGSIAFKDVTFEYNDRTPVLKGIDIELEAGKTYALVGASGAGKTTFANLIPRFYEAKEGAISIDGIGVKDMRLRDLRKNIAIVNQDPTLFKDSIYNNILIGNPRADKSEVIEAAQKAFAHDFIMSLEKQYDYDCGQSGTTLSGGQKQRIAIARAFLKNAPILILDEATSALDAISERYIQKALEHLMVGKTVIIIAHRFSSIKHADEILVFEDGQVVERGTHEALYANNGKYQKLYEQQMPSKDDNKEEAGLYPAAV